MFSGSGQLLLVLASLAGADLRYQDDKGTQLPAARPLDLPTHDSCIDAPQLKLKVPEGTSGGTVLNVEQNGITYKVTVPEDLLPGDQFTADLAAVLPTGTETGVTFRSTLLSSAKQCLLAWIDPENGKEDALGPITPSEDMEINTYVGHEFHIRNYATKQQFKIQITGPGTWIVNSMGVSFQPLSRRCKSTELSQAVLRYGLHRRSTTTAFHD